MPNNVTHKVVVSGRSEELAAFEENCMGIVEEGYDKGSQFLDFNKIIPFPKELDGICSGICHIDGEKVRRWREIDGENIAISEEDQKEMMEKFGADCLYEWNIENWGTKWNSYGFHFTYSDSESMGFELETAWSPAEPIFNKLAEMYPSLTFYVSCFDEGWNFAGKGFFSNEETTFEVVEATDAMYEEVYGYEPEEEGAF
jgi:hypothetical protein